MERGPSDIHWMAQNKEAAMDNSIYQARWLLAPVFGLGFAFITLGAVFG